VHREPRRHGGPAAAASTAPPRVLPRTESKPPWRQEPGRSNTILRPEIAERGRRGSRQAPSPTFKRNPHMYISPSKVAAAPETKPKQTRAAPTSCPSLMARRPLLPLLSLALLLLVAALSSSSVVCAAVEPRHSEGPAMAPTVAIGHVARQEFHVAPAGAGIMSRNGATSTRPVQELRRSTRRGRGGGTGAWVFSAMLPRGFVPPSESSACRVLPSRPPQVPLLRYHLGGSWIRVPVRLVRP
jgi:hypothetical protein